MRHVATLLTSLVFLLGAAPRDLGPTIKPIADAHKLPGVVAAIVHGDKLFALGSTGVRKLGDPTPFDPADLIHLGSDTKAMTGLLIGQLIDDHKLRLDAPMAKVFPDLAGRMDEAYKAVTVRDLLDHTAGFEHDLNWGALDATRKPLMEQRRQAVEEALSKPPAKPIGKYSYSNVGYTLLGAIVEAKTGKPWEDVITDRLFRPLKMSTASFGPPGTQGKTDAPWGHVKKGDDLKPVHYDNPAVMAPAGRVHCSMADWAKFVGETLRGAEGHPTLVSAETFKAITTPRKGENYAAGWITAPRGWANGVTLSHAGSNTTWFCIAWLAPKKDTAYLVATNFGGDDAGKATDEMVGAMIKLDVGAPVGQ